MSVNSPTQPEEATGVCGCVQLDRNREAAREGESSPQESCPLPAVPLREGLPLPNSSTERGSWVCNSLAGRFRARVDRRRRTQRESCLWGGGERPTKKDQELTNSEECHRGTERKAAS